MSAAGVIKRLNGESGFGFIKPDNGGKRDFFFHKSGCRCDFADLGEGMRVTFEPTEGAKGPRAEDVDIED